MHVSLIEVASKRNSRMCVVEASNPVSLRYLLVKQGTITPLLSIPLPRLRKNGRNGWTIQ